MGSDCYWVDASLEGFIPEGSACLGKMQTQHALISSCKENLHHTLDTSFKSSVLNFGFSFLLKSPQSIPHSPLKLGIFLCSCVLLSGSVWSYQSVKVPMCRHNKGDFNLTDCVKPGVGVSSQAIVILLTDAFSLFLFFLYVMNSITLFHLSYQGKRHLPLYPSWKNSKVITKSVYDEHLWHQDIQEKNREY